MRLKFSICRHETGGIVFSGIIILIIVTVQTVHCGNFIFNGIFQRSGLKSGYLRL